MESTAARRPPANDEGVCGMFINLFRRQRPALAGWPATPTPIVSRWLRPYHRPQSAYPASPLHPPQPTQPPQPAYPRWMPTIGRIHDIPQSAMSRLTGSPTVYAR